MCYLFISFMYNTIGGVNPSGPPVMLNPTRGMSCRKRAIFGSISPRSSIQFARGTYTQAIDTILVVTVMLV